MFGSSSPKNPMALCFVNLGPCHQRWGLMEIHLDLRKGQWTLSTPECVKGNWFGLVQVKKVARHTWNVETSGTPKAGFRLVQGCSGCFRFQFVCDFRLPLRIKVVWSSGGVGTRTESTQNCQSRNYNPSTPSQHTYNHLPHRGKEALLRPFQEDCERIPSTGTRGRPTTKAIRAVGGVSLGTMFQCRLVVMKIIPT